MQKKKIYHEGFYAIPTCMEIHPTCMQIMKTEA